MAIVRLLDGYLCFTILPPSNLLLKRNSCGASSTSDGVGRHNEHALLVGERNLGADLISLCDPRAHKYAKPLPKAASWKMADELLVAVLSSSPAGSAGLAGDGVARTKPRW